MKKFCLCLLLALLTTAGHSQPTTKIALVIGVQNYTHVAPLRHSLNDATDMAAVLKSKGFQVEYLKDPKTKQEVKEAITRYYNAMKDLDKAVGVIYYAGHGVQFEGENYLIPASANIQVPGDMNEQCVKMNTVMSVLASSNSSLNILLLDACRTNSFPSFNRDVEKGLNSVEPPTGSIVVFATQPGSVASDGTGKNGLFTSKLLKYINEPNLNIGDVLKKVKQDVNAESNGMQLPSVVDNSIGGDFYFTATAGATVVKESITKQETPTAFDYGYGPSDAPTVKIGSQTWTTKNLNVDHFANGDPIPKAKNPEAWRRAAKYKRPAWCYYGYDSLNGRAHGRLYNWYAVVDPRGLAPKGWRVPNEADWIAIVDHLDGETAANVAMKSKVGWPANLNGNNSSGFSGAPSGSASPADGECHNLDKDGFWWSSADGGTEVAWAFSLGFFSEKTDWHKLYKSSGFSVRCLKD